MTSVLISRLYNAGTDRKPEWKQVSYLVAGECFHDRLPDKSAAEVAFEKTKEMLKGKK